jgi:site-specific recombinase XerD
MASRKREIALAPVATAVVVLPELDAALAAYDAAAARFLATRKSERTQANYGHALALYRDHAVQNGADPLRADCLIAWSRAQNRQRRDAGGDLSNDTIRLRLHALQSFLSWAWAFGLTPLKPELVASMVTIPPARQLSPRDILTPDEVRCLLQAAEEERDRCLLRVMLDAGLRVSEALDLRCGDVYTASDRCWLHVARGKGDKARDVEIPRTLYTTLATYARAAGLDLLSPTDERRRLFELDRGNAWRMVSKTAARAGITKRVTPHSLRHTHAHHLRLADLPLEVIGARLGHATLETTKRYTRPAELAQQLPLPLMPWAN